MSLIPWRGKSRELAAEGTPLASLKSELDRLLENFMREPLGALDYFSGPRDWSPAVEVSENEREITVRAELPGIAPQDLDVSLTGNMLVISGEKRDASEKNEKEFYRSEIRFGAFRRTIPLPEGVDPEKVDAQHSNGVLTVRVEKLQSAVPKKVEIKTQS